MLIENNTLIPLLPLYPQPQTLLIGDQLPCHAAITSKPIAWILKELKRQEWVEGLFAKGDDLHKIKRYLNLDESYKNDFSEAEFLAWVTVFEENTAICDMENSQVGKGVFVLPGKTLPKDTFIPSSGIIKLNPTREELETKSHCSALQDLDSPQKPIMGLIDPEKKGGILDLINHAPDENELLNFKFKNASVKDQVATSNLKSVIKFYRGYSIMGLVAPHAIHGGSHGKQLLWSYAHPDEYIDEQSECKKALLLFDHRDEHNGETLDQSQYSLKIIHIFINTGELIVRKIASLPRWEIMHASPESSLIISTEDPYSYTRSEIIQSPITHGLLQQHLKDHPDANRIILNVAAIPFLSI